MADTPERKDQTMTPEQIEQMRADMETGTPGPWVAREHWADEEKREVAPTYDAPPDFGMWSAIAEVSGHGGDEGEVQAAANARRIARVPDMEAEILRLREVEQAQSAKIVRGLVEALQEIAKPQYGLQGIIEDGDSDEERARYFGSWCSRYQAKARAALAAYEKEARNG